MNDMRKNEGEGMKRRRRKGRRVRGRHVPNGTCVCAGVRPTALDSCVARTHARAREVEKAVALWKGRALLSLVGVGDEGV